MPFSIRKLKNEKLYKVYNTITKRIHAYHTTLKNAERQLRLLNSVSNSEGGRIYKNKSNGLYGDQIENILSQHGYKINGVFSKDKLPKELNDGWYVVNMQSSNQGNKHGTHWICFKSIGLGDVIEYFDSFGFSPPIQILQKVKRKLLYSTRQIQDEFASTCGWFVIGAIISDNGYKLSETHFKKYINMFSSNTELNDKILSNYLLSRGIR